MGFSLSRAMQGAAMGAAHAAGEIFDGMIAEERKTRELDAAMQRQMQAQEQMDVRRDELAGAREASRDALKEELSKRKQQEVTDRMGAYYTATREKGLDPNKLEGLRHIANSALEKGDIGVYDKITDNIDKREKNLSDAENRKLQISALHESRAMRKREGMDAEDKAAMNSILRIADRLTVPGQRDPDDPRKVIGDPDKDAANAALAWAESENAKGRSWKSVRSDLTQIIDGFGKQPAEIKKLPAATRFNAALDFWNMPEDKRRAPAKATTPTPAPAQTRQAPSAAMAPERRGLLGALLGAGENKPFDPNAEPALGD